MKNFTLMECQDTSLVYDQLGRFEPAEAEYRAAKDAAQELARRRPGDWGARSALIDALNSLAGLLIKRGRHAEAEGPVTEALEVSGPLVAAYPETIGYVLRDARLRIYQGQLRHAKGRDDEAEVTYRDAIARLEALCRKKPDLREARQELANVYERCPLVRLRDPQRAQKLRAESDVARGPS